MVDNKDKEGQRAFSKTMLNEIAYQSLASAYNIQDRGYSGPVIKGAYITAYQMALAAIEKGDNDSTKEILKSTLGQLHNSSVEEQGKTPGNLSGHKVYENTYNSVQEKLLNVTIGDVYELIGGEIKDKDVKKYADKYIGDLIQSENQQNIAIATTAMNTYNKFITDRLAQGTLEKIVKSHPVELEHSAKNILGIRENGNGNRGN